MKRAVIILVVVIAVLCVAIRAGLTFVVDRGIAQAREAISADGGEVRHDRVESRESAFETGRRFHALVVRQPDGAVFTAEILDVGIPAWDWRRAAWDGDGLVRVEQPGQWILTATEPAADSLIGLNGRLAALSLATPTLRIDSLSSGIGLVAEAFSVDYEREASSQAGTTLKGSAERLDAEPMALAVENLTLDAGVHPPWPVDATQSAISRWQAEEGSARITSLHGDLPAGGTIDIDATVRLDEALQPVGEGRIRIGDYEKVVDLLIDRSFIAQDAAVMVKLTVGLIAAADEDGDPTALTLPLSLQGGQITAGEFLIGTVPQILWPEG